jgi:hypothetical protein
VSGDRVREALAATMRPHVDALPPDPLASVAQQLELSQQQVCEAFADGSATTEGKGTVTHLTPGDGRPHTTTSFVAAGKAIDLSTLKAVDVTLPAQRLGVSADRLAGALRAAAPTTPPPAPPSEHEFVGSLARNLGLSEDKVRAALREVEGSGPFTFVVPLPALGH